MVVSRTPEAYTLKLRFEAYGLYGELSNAARNRARELNVGFGAQAVRALSQDERWLRLHHLAFQAHRRWGRRSGPAYEYGHFELFRKQGNG
jgi:hypothetical protein